MMRKLIFVFFILLLICGCSPPKSYSDVFGKVDNVSSITLMTPSVYMDVAFTKYDSIVDPKLILQLVSDINNAKQEGPYKAAHKYMLKIVTKDSAIIFKTNGTVFGYDYDGFMFTFEKDIIKEYWNIN